MVNSIERGLRASLVSAGGSGALMVTKIVVGHLIGSITLVADGVHSASDVVGGLLVWLGLRVSEIPPDVEHPYGHYKAESLAELGLPLSSSFLVASYRL